MNVNNVKGSEFFVLIFFYIFIFSSLSIDNVKVSLYSDNPEETDVVQVFEVPAPQIEKACPWKFAVKRKVCLPLDNRWSEKELGPNRLMTLIIQADDAKSINLGITKYELPEKVKLFLFDKNGVPSKGPFTNKHRTVKGEFWTPIVEGEILYVKLFIPKEISNDQISFEIGSINCAYHNTSTVCGINAPREGHKWRAQARSVAWYHVEGIYVGSGVLLNNTDSDFKPYFLSANHCRITEDNVSSMVIYWNYESPEPGIRNGGKLERFQFGATLCARDDRDPEACDNEGSDFVLVKLNEKPKPEWNVYYSGWDARGEIPKSKVFGIHHPRTIEKAMCIALEEQVTSTRFNWDNEDSEGKFWRIEEWGIGTTEDGSSGSGLWEAATNDNDDSLLVGQLIGSLAGCKCAPTTEPISGPAWYGKFSESWSGDGTKNTRLWDWLAPDCNGKKIKLKGAEPSERRVHPE